MQGLLLKVLVMAANSTTSLLDLPDHVLWRCMPISERAIELYSAPRNHCPEREQCMQACRSLLGVLLSGSRSRSPSLSLDLSEPGKVQQVRATLQRTTKCYPELQSLHVVLPQDPAGLYMLQELLLAPHSSVVQGWLPQISKMVIENALFPLPCGPQQHTSNRVGFPTRLIPHSVAQACPNLDSLHVKNFHYVQPMLPVMPSLTNLRQLALESCAIDFTADTFRNQLAALSSLQDLRILNELKDQYCTTIAEALSSRLTALTYTGHQAFTVLLAKPYTQLKSLSVPCTSVDDMVIEAILQNARALSKLAVSDFRLETDYSARQCSWQEVHFCSALDVEQVPRLPLVCGYTRLYGVRDLKISLPKAAGDAAEGLQLVAAGVAAVQQAGGLARGSRELEQQDTGHGGLQAEVILNGVTPAHRPQMLSALLPMLSTVVNLTLTGFTITHDTLKALGTQLASCRQLVLGCEYERGIWGKFVSLLPRVDTLVMISGATVMQLAILIAGADHELTLCVDEIFYYDDDDAAFATLREAIQDAGHGLVRLGYYDLETRAVTD